MFEFAKSSHRVHFRLFAICADWNPRKLLREMECGDSQEVADAIANWAFETLALAAIRPSDATEGCLDIPNSRAPDGACSPPKKDASQKRYSPGKKIRPGRTT